MTHGTGSTPPELPTLGALRAAGIEPRSVKEEVRANLVARLRRGDPLTTGVVGYDDTVLPQLERAILAGQDLILLGERGQAKTRLVRRLVELLDPWVPIVAGCEINCSPWVPTCASCRRAADEHGEDLPIAWIDRDRRFAEKLATPDAAVADLIGDVDPIKVAEGRTLGDEETIHWGLVPRHHRGIVAINELPDLPERIQVALLNVLEERDVQIRGYSLRLPLDVLLVATANPDDYTNRGRIISPLKDRFGAQVRTHYPHTIDDEVAIVTAEATPPPTDVRVHVPRYLDEVLAELVHLLRESPDVNQRSGVSVRFTIGAHETLVAAAVRRAARTGADTAVPRVIDLRAVLPAALGRIEFDLLEDGQELEIVEHALARAVLTVWRRHLGGESFDELIERFEQGGLTVDTGDLLAGRDLLAAFDGPITGLARWLQRLGEHERQEDPEVAASAVEFVLEGLHLGRRLNRDELDAFAVRYGA
ncbi:MAG: sigma 54-interacting transcriptional regulator [Nitriliruptoraceae bacterium]|nr:sigma 54-interacting transcriptional regulator [Nitriliruptoraceae bacterium]